MLALTIMAVTLTDPVKISVRATTGISLADIAQFLRAIGFDPRPFRVIYGCTLDRRRKSNPLRFRDAFEASP